MDVNRLPSRPKYLDLDYFEPSQAPHATLLPSRCKVWREIRGKLARWPFPLYLGLASRQLNLKGGAAFVQSQAIVFAV